MALYKILIEYFDLMQKIVLIIFCIIVFFAVPLSFFTLQFSKEGINAVNKSTNIEALINGIIPNEKALSKVKTCTARIHINNLH